MESLTVWHAAKEISTAVGSILSTYKSYRAVRKRDLRILEQKIETYIATEKTKSNGEKIRANIEEIAKTQRYIDEQNLTGLALELAIGQLRNLNDMLNSDLRMNA